MSDKPVKVYIVHRIHDFGYVNEVLGIYSSRHLANKRRDATTRDEHDAVRVTVLVLNEDTERYI